MLQDIAGIWRQFRKDIWDFCVCSLACLFGSVMSMGLQLDCGSVNVGLLQWNNYVKFFLFFFSIRVFFTDTEDSQNSRGREGTVFYSTLPPPSANEHWDIYLQLCMWDDYHIFLIAAFVFTRLLRDEIYHFIELPFEWLLDDTVFVCLLNELILGFCYSDLTLDTGGFKLASTITLVLAWKRKLL